MKRDPRIDAYIERQAEFARPILEHLRKVIHAANPEIEEAVRWGIPHFVYQGKQLASMAAFKAHAAFGFWNDTVVPGGTELADKAMGQFGRLTRLEDLPGEAMLTDLVRKAAALTDQGVKRVRKAAGRPAIETPEDLRTALDADPAAAAIFDSFSSSARRDYAEWIVEAKRPATRARRVAQAVAWIAEGRKRHWKYEKCGLGSAAAD